MKIIVTFLMLVTSYAMANGNWSNKSWEEIQADPKLEGGFPEVVAGVTLDKMCLLADGETLESIAPVSICTEKVLQGRQGYKCVNTESLFVRASNTIVERHPIANRGYTRKEVKTSYSDKYDSVPVFFIGESKHRLGEKAYSIPSCLN